MKDIKAVIFDLGGVIIDLDIDRTLKGFSSLSGFSPEKVKEIYETHPVFHDFEKGLLDDNAFRLEVRNLFQSDHVDNNLIDEAWNAMLLGIALPKLELMKKLKDRYQVMILSNTNSIHVTEMYNRILPEVSGARSFDPFVHKVYYSHLLHMRKPDVEIFQFVLDDYKLNPRETVFLDDNPDNVRGAEQAGIVVKHITDANQVFDLF